MTLTTVTVTKASESEYIIADADTAEPIEFVRRDPDDDLWHAYDAHGNILSHWAPMNPSDIIGLSVRKWLNR